MLVDPHGGAVVCEAQNGQAVIYQYKQQGQPKVKVLTLDRAKILPGWTLQGPVCDSPVKWTPDFGHYLVAGSPPGSQVSHVVDVDVAAGTFTDLTAPRQKSGFSDPVLYENDPVFMSDEPSSTPHFGSNMVVINQSIEGHAGFITIDRRNPTEATPMPEDTTSPFPNVPAGHLELYLKDDVHMGDYGSFSPDGVYLAEDYGLRPSADPGKSIRVECPDWTTGAHVFFLGWTDATHVIYSDNRRPALVTASDHPTCQPLIPATDKFISSVGLSEDGAKLYFKASNANGGDTEYSMPANSPGASPVPDPFPNTPLHELYRPGNY